MSAAPKIDAARAEYDAIDALNWSTLVHLQTSAKLLRWRAEHPRTDSPALRIGRAIHCAILEPERWATDYVARPDFGDLRTKAAKAARAEWLVTLDPDVEVLTPDEHALAERCARAVREHPVAADLLRGGRAEETIVWTDEATGLKCKARLDYLRPVFITDLKSTRARDLEEFSREVSRYLYHGQLAFYHRGAVAARAIPGDEAPRIVAVQTVEPFDVAPMELHPEALAKGDGLCRTLLTKYAQHRAADYWPGLAPNLVRLNVPTWAPAGDADMDLDDGDEW